MTKILNLLSKTETIVIGLMSGTSVDGIDASIVKIKQLNNKIALEEICFETYKFPDDVRKRIFDLFSDDKSNSKNICHMNFLLGELFADACFEICTKANIKISEVDIIGSHGQTIYHMPETITDNDFEIKSTLQIGEGSVIADRTSVVTVSDFRTADMASGGLGAPLVPYTEYVLFKSDTENVAFQNIGGVGNITAIPKNAKKSEVIAFDTGPGNMIIDYFIDKITNGEKTFDENGDFASKGTVNEVFLAYLLEDNYFKLNIPKTTGREYFGKVFCDDLWDKMKDLSDFDKIATVTAFTAKSIKKSIDDFVPFKLDKLIIGGGGAFNKTLLKYLKQYIPDTNILTNEELGFNSNSKEATAFALLAYETIHQRPSNLKSVTGAKREKILGKINL